MRFLSGRVALAAAMALSLAATPASAQNAAGTIRGRVLDAATQRPLNGVQVSVPGTGRGALTNAMGEYTIATVAAGPRQVRATMLGYANAEQTITVAAGETVRADFQLSQTAIALDAVVVTGTPGGTQQRAIGNAVATVNAAAITEVAPIRSAAELLQGRTPGLTIMQASGTPGTASNIRIRGAGSVAAGNTPVFVIDGVRMTAGTQAGWSVSGQQTSALDAINPEDIESIEVIKGPAAATLYGAEAAAGVIQIITKKGTRGQQGLRWTARAETGRSEWNAGYPTQYGHCTPARIRQANTIAAAAGNFPNGSYPGCVGIDSLLPLDQRILSSTLLRDDPRALRVGEIRSEALSVRGGGENFSFFFSGDRDYESGVFQNSDFGRTSGRANFTVAPTSNLDVAITTSYSRTHTRLPNNDNSSWGMLRNIFRAPAGMQGTYERGYLGLGPDQIHWYDNRTRAERAIFGTTVNYAPAPWLRNRINAGLDWNQRVATLFLPIDRGTPAAYGTSNARGTTRQYLPNTRNWTLDYAGTASLPVSPSLQSETSFGLQLNAYRFEAVQADGWGLISNQVRLVSNAEERDASESFSEQNSVGLFVQQQMGWQNRLFLTGALRFDDNSAFGSEFSRAVYPKAQVSWVVSEEPFFHVAALDQLRLRAAWGRAGTSPAPFSADRTYNTSEVVLADGTIAGGLRADAFGNTNLKPETGQEIELGFDASVLNDRLGVEFTYYRQRTYDALMNVPVAPSSGFGTFPSAPAGTGVRLANVGEISNNGMELGVFGTPISTPRFNWDARVGFSTNQNVMVSFGGSRDEPIPVGYRSSQRHAEGYPLGGYWAFPAQRDANGALVLDAQGRAINESQMVFIGPSTPTREASLTNTFTVMRNLSIHTFFDYKGGHHLFHMSGQTADQDGVSYLANNPASDPEAWAIFRSGTTMPYMHRADFIKLRELSFSYALPRSLVQRFGSGTGLSFTLAGRNLATWTDYPGLDPETNIEGAADFTRGESNSVPPTRRWVATVNLNF